VERTNPVAQNRIDRMAQDVVAPRAQSQPHGAGRWLHNAVASVRDLLPASPPMGPVDYTPGLIAYVVSTALAAIAVAVVAVVFRFPIGDQIRQWQLILVVGGVTIFLMSIFAVRQGQGARFQWTPTMFIHLGLAFAFGPAGAAVGAVAEPFGVAIKSRNGWFRTTFNISNEFLADTAAWAVFRAIDGGDQSGRALLAGLCAGLVHWGLNSGFVAVVQHLAERTTPLPTLLRSRVSVLPYSLGYGFAAFAFVVMSTSKGVIGFTALLAPIILLHYYLLRYTQGLRKFEAKRAEDELDKLRLQLDKERLQLQALEASERERANIARNLHDGVVQNLAGINYELTAEASRLKAGSDTIDDRENLALLLNDSATRTRDAMRDLRTLIIDLVPPTLRREGLEAALLEVLAEIKRKGTNTKLDLPPNLRLRQDRAALIFRIANESLRNVAAHAQAKNVTVELTTEDGSAILSIQDDGKGFSEADVAERRKEGHLGTQAIEDLAAEAGGSLTTDTELGRGTLVVLTLPIE
jgi:signal transduction histidine kinase